MITRKRGRKVDDGEGEALLNNLCDGVNRCDLKKENRLVAQKKSAATMLPCTQGHYKQGRL